MRFEAGSGCPQGPRRIPQRNPTQLNSIQLTFLDSSRCESGSSDVLRRVACSCRSSFSACQKRLLARWAGYIGSVAVLRGLRQPLEFQFCYGFEVRWTLQLWS